MSQEELIEEGLSKFQPKRYTNRGRRPTIKYLESDIVKKNSGPEEELDTSSDLQRVGSQDESSGFPTGITRRSPGGPSPSSPLQINKNQVQLSSPPAR